MASGCCQAFTLFLQLVGVRNCDRGDDFAHVLPYERRICVLLRVRIAREAPPCSSRTCEGAGRRGACFGCVSFEAESRNKIAISLAGLGGRKGYDKFIFVPSYWTSHPGSPQGVTCVLPAVLEPGTQASLYPSCSAHNSSPSSGFSPGVLRVWFAVGYLAVPP